MNALKIDGYIDEDGLKIGIDKLKMFKNQDVEIIILPKDQQRESKNKSCFFNAVGKIIIDGDEIRSLRELSKI